MRSRLRGFPLVNAPIPRDLTADQLAILISRRFSTVRMADHLAVLDQGEVSEPGTHDELLAEGRT